MQSVVFEQFGEPADVLKVQTVSAPVAGPGEVLVRMLASPVNPSDLMNVRGIYTLRPTLPATPGFEGVGVVTASGGGLLGRIMVGKRVAVLNRDRGNWCEQTVVSARQVIPLPASLPLEQAAMFFVNPATAYIMTREVLRVPSGEWLVQTAAASALGRMVVRLAQHSGFRTLNIVRREDQAQILRDLGATEVIVFDPEHQTAGDLHAAVTAITGARGIRYAIDSVAGATGSALVPCLGDGGQLLVFGTLSSEPLTFSSRLLMTHEASVRGFWLGHYMSQLKLIAKLKLIRRISALIQSGILGSECGSQFPLAEVNQAVRAAEAQGRHGKVLLKIADS